MKVENNFVPQGVNAKPVTAITMGVGRHVKTKESSADSSF